MAVTTPPFEVWGPVEGLAPGIYRDFISRVVRGLSGPDVFLSSWWRSPIGNQRVGGNPNSQHLLGLAFDLVVPNPQLVVTALNRQGVIALNEGDHVHVQLLAAGRVAPVVKALGLLV